MKGSVRFLIAFFVSICLELIFFSFSASLLKGHKTEVKEVIRISLIEPEEKRFTIKKADRKPGRKKKTNSKPIEEKPKLESTKPEKNLSAEKKVAKKPSPKGNGGLKSLSGNLPATYIDAVRRAIQNSIFYPVEAIQMGKKGKVEVTFTIDRSGKVLNCRGISGERILKQAACISVKKASIPPIPETVKNETLTFQLEVNYDLRKAISSY